MISADRRPATANRPFSVLSLALLLAVVCLRPSLAAESKSAGDAELFDRLDANRDGKVTADELKPEDQHLFERLLRKADANHDGALTRDEFLKSLVPTRPEKPISPKDPAGENTDAVRYMLLKLDANMNSRIEKSEIPKELRPIFEVMLERLDANNDGQLDRLELSRSGPGLAQLAARYVEREGIDVKTELPKLEKAQGAAADRFDDNKGPFERLADPVKARQMFRELDSNNDGYLSEKELSEVFRDRADQFLQRADRNRDGRLSQSEFLEAADRLTRFMNRQAKDDRREMKTKKNAVRAGNSANSTSPDKN